MAGLLSSAANFARSKIKEGAKDAIGYTSKAILYVNYDPTAGADLIAQNPVTTLNSAFKGKLIVQYNPASISIQTFAGTFQNPNMGGAGMNQVSQMTLPANTELTVTLVFDSMATDNAFQYSRFTNLSVQRVAADLTTMAKKFTVKNEVEALVSLILNDKTRIVEFDWANMSFMGEVTNINAQYTMFNPEADPVRATVTLTIQQHHFENNSDGSVNPINTAFNKIWDNKIDKVFGETDGLDNVSTNDSDNTLSFIQNLINL